MSYEGVSLMWPSLEEGLFLGWLGQWLSDLFKDPDTFHHFVPLFSSVHSMNGCHDKWFMYMISFQRSLGVDSLRSGPVITPIAHCTDEDTEAWHDILPKITQHLRGEWSSSLCLSPAFLTWWISRPQKMPKNSLVDACISFTSSPHFLPFTLARSVFQLQAIWRHHYCWVSLFKCFKLKYDTLAKVHFLCVQ